MRSLSFATFAFALSVYALPQFPGWYPHFPPPPGNAHPVPITTHRPEPSGASLPSVTASAVPKNTSSSMIAIVSSLPASILPMYPIANSSVISGTGGVSSVVGTTISSVTPVSVSSSINMPSASASFIAFPSGLASSSAAAASSGSTVTSVPATGSSFSSGSGMPASSGTSVLSAAQTIAAGESFDCGMVMYDRGADCTDQVEGADSDAVFILEAGASLSNCIIGPNQIEGVHCFGGCSLSNVWWSAVCEDAFTVKEQDAGETTTIVGGGAFGADDKVLQHNGGGTISVSGFTVDTFGKVYRSCGNCDSMYERHVIMDDISATGGSVIAGINSNYGDLATLTNIKVSDVDDICITYTGNDNGDEPEENGSGPSKYCIYDDSDVTGI